MTPGVLFLKTVTLINLSPNINIGKIHSLTFKAVKPEDAGEITLMAERVSSTATLRVEGNK